MGDVEMLLTAAIILVEPIALHARFAGRLAENHCCLDLTESVRRQLGNIVISVAIDHVHYVIVVNQQPTIIITGADH